MMAEVVLDYPIAKRMQLGEMKQVVVITTGTHVVSCLADDGGRNPKYFRLF